MHGTNPSVVPVILAGVCAFLTLFAPQPLLPMLGDIFHASKVMISLMVTATTVGVALAAPVMGQIADRAGRKRVIVASAATLGIATLLTATSASLGALLFWRFVQGIATPGVFSVTTAYVHDQWPVEKAASAISAYVSGTVVGGFLGRVISGFAAEHLGWQSAFLLLGCINLAIAAYLAFSLRADDGAVPTPMGHAMAEHLRNPQLVAAYTVGACVLFTQTAMFTYVAFHLAAPPFSLSAGLIGSIFVVYLIGAGVTPLAGRHIGHEGHRMMMVRAALLGASGALLTIVPNVWAVVAGLAACCSGVFISQAAATSYVGVAAPHNRALALGLYVSFYYAGGSLGGTAPGWLWQKFGWPGCVALVIAVQMVIASVAWTRWGAVRHAGVPADALGQ